MTIGMLLDMAAQTEPDRIILGSRTGGLTYEHCVAKVQAGGAWLSQQPGETLVFIGLNGPAMPVALFAAAHAGKPFAPLNYRLPDADLRRLLARTAPSIAIVDEDMIGRVEGIPGVDLVTRGDFEGACAQTSLDSSPADDPDIAVLLFTSGTTGQPKAAVLRHRHLTAYVLGTVEYLGALEDEASLVSVPPYHIAGVSAVLTGVYSGRRIVHLPAFTPEAWVETAIAENITHAMVVPTMLSRILDVAEARGAQLPHLQALSYGGGRMPQQVIERALALWPQVNYVNAYGLTETSSTVSVLTPEDHRDAIGSADPLVRRRLGSVGKPLPGLELEIRGSDGAVQPPGAPGEVHVRGEQIAGEYLGDTSGPGDGWFATKDSGWLDHEGYLFLDGRLDDVIVRGGENISPGEIEDVLRTHPGVADVAVFGLPHTQWGEQVAAVIVPHSARPSIEELAEWVAKRLRSTKTPEKWEFRTELPYNETGKLLRRVLRADLAEALDGADAS
jgi:fatty-acyl-CoA synthase